MRVGLIPTLYLYREGVIDVSWSLALLTALTANLDNLGVGLAYGVKGIKLSWQANGVIAVVAFAFTWFAERAGSLIKLYFGVASAHVTGAVLIMAIGSWILGGAVFSTNHMYRPEQADRDRSQHISAQEALILGIALSVNAIPIGFEAAAFSFPDLIMPCLIAIFSFLTLWCGVVFGKLLGAAHTGKRTTILSGVLLVVIGLYQLFSFISP